MNKLLILLLATLLLSACTKRHGNVDALAFQAETDAGWGLIGTDGQVQLPAGTLPRQPSAVVNGLFSLPDSTGLYQLYSIRQPDKPICLRRFACIGHFFEETAPAQETPQSPILLIDRQGRTVASTEQYPQYHIVRMHNFSNGRALIVTRDGKYGYMDTRGRLAIPPLYDQAYDFHEGLALTGIRNAQGQTGYQLITPQGETGLAVTLQGCRLGSRMGEGLLPFRENNSHRCGYLDLQGGIAFSLPQEVTEAYTFRHGMAVMQTATATGLISLDGGIQLPAVYENIRILGKERIALKDGKDWCLAQSDGTPLTGYTYSYIGGYYPTGLAVAQADGRSFFIDLQGKRISAEEYALLAEDPAARQECPQVFVRKEEKEEEKAEETASKVRAETTEAELPEVSPQRNVPQENHYQNTIRPDEWKRIGEKNPFYGEARKVLSGKLEEADAQRRQMILNYVEHLRTSYTTKDIDFLEQLFSENALIIVGTVVRTGTVEENGYLSPNQVVYNVKSKRQYLDRLKQVFHANREIDVRFDKFRILRHPTQPGIYGVSLHQNYRSDIYTDDGYLFLLWDFRDETAPKIHVRTWQPGMTDRQTPLPEEEVFGIGSFNLE